MKSGTSLSFRFDIIIMLLIRHRLRLRRVLSHTIPISTHRSISIEINVETFLALQAVAS